MQKLFPAAAAAIAVLGQSGMAQENGAISGVYKTDPTHRYITFSYSHAGYSNPWLRWRDWEGTLDWNADAPEESSINVVIDANSIDSGVDVFDGHLKEDRFFDVANYPQITFVSTSIEKTGETTGVIAGDLTIKDVTKPVELDVTFNKGEFDERNNRYKIGFSAETTVKRSDYGVDLYAPVVSDEVDIIIETEFLMPAES
ncbi:MAG: YceI family protein, partial [Hyphococcus sp.]